MNTKYRWLIVPALFVGAGSLLFAQDPVAERSAGQVLLLKNGNAVEGDIVKIGTQMCVRRGKSEIWIDADKSTRLCADWNDAYTFLQARLKFGSADDRLRFARWCQMNQLKDQALEQGRLAVQMEPGHREAKLFLAMLERVSKEAPPTPIVPVQKPTTVTSTPHIDVDAETFASFAARVQPILMNKCAACHASGGFRLDRVSNGGQAGAIRNNLDAVLLYLDVEKPGRSPVLVKAVEAHGGSAEPPLKDRKDVPAQILLAWIERTIAANARVKQYYAAKKPAKATEVAKTVPLPAQPIGVVVSSPEPRVEVAVEPKVLPSLAVTPPQVQLHYLQAVARKQVLPAPVQQIAGSLYQQIERGKVEPVLPKEVSHPAVSQPMDAFDPVLFNQANHPNGPSWLNRPSASVNR